MTVFTVMTWNVQNLFLPGHPDGPVDQPTFDQKLASLAAVINQAQPHILALQEVGSGGVLGQLQAALTHKMPHAIEGEPDGREIRVAFLSTIQFSAPRDLRPFPNFIRSAQNKDPI